MTNTLFKPNKTLNSLIDQANRALTDGNVALAAHYWQQGWLEQTENFSDNEALIASFVPIALQILARGDFQIRWDMAKLFPSLGDRVVKPLISVLEGETQDLEHCEFAAQILGNFDQPAVIIALVNVLQTRTDEALQAMAISALGRIGPSAIEVLSQRLGDPPTRLLAIQALAQIRRTEVIEPLLSVVSDADPKIRSKAIEALGNFSDPRILPILKSSLQDLAASVRKEALIALSFRLDEGDSVDLLRLLQPRLYDLNLEVCQQAAIVLSKIPNDQSAKALFEVLKTPHTPLLLQLALIQCLAWQKNPTSLSYLQQALNYLNLEGVLEIIRVLGRRNHDKIEAAQILADFFMTNHPLIQEVTIRQALAYSLGQLQVNKTQEILETLSQDTETIVRLHAIAALRYFSDH
ncbi:MAG: HEAT repeat domain-containing protein [Snowella sp.]|nr:HEAT repeat domain-containing protein [Snowella sp.]